MHGKSIHLDDVSMTYPNGFTAVHPTDMTVNAGEFFSILGPSGCGKTTILRMVSGFLTPTGGDIRIGDESVVGIGPNKRPTALIFQNLALFPLLSVRDNVAFGLEARGVAKRERHGRAEELLELVALKGQENKMPGELSGGQRQRVAIARALAVEPAVLLLDEPLSALDLKLRQHMRSELQEIQRKTGVTFIYITHDQGEALSMSDRVAVMNEGRIEQVSTPQEIYNSPRTQFTATFVGEQNIFAGKVIEADAASAAIETAQGTFKARNPNALAKGDQAIVLVRPERIQILEAANGRSDTQPENRLAARMTRSNLEGAVINMQLQAGEQVIEIHSQNHGQANIAPGSELEIGFGLNDAVAMGAE